VALQQRRGAPSSYPPGATGVLDSDWFSPNTAVGACRECSGLGKLHRITEQTLVPDPSLSIRDRAVAAWPGAWHGQNLRDILVTLGHDIGRPWRELPQSERDWILFTEEQPTADVHRDRAEVQADYSYRGTFSSARRHVLHTLGRPPSCAPGSSASSTCWTSPRPGCTRPMPSRWTSWTG
jgi:excinuclease ABC subunit A